MVSTSLFILTLMRQVKRINIYLTIMDQNYIKLGYYLLFTLN